MPTATLSKTRPASKTARRKAAEARWEELRSGFVNMERVLIECIKEKDWLDLGYATFAEAWVDRLQGIRLAQQGLKPVVVEQLLTEGLSDEEIVETIGFGIGSFTVARYRDRFNKGIPLSHVRSFDRIAHNTPSDYITVPLPADEVARFKERCKLLGRDWRVEAAAAIRASLAKMERAKQ